MARFDPTWIASLGLLLLAGPLRGAAIDPYLPDDTEAVLSVNVEQFLGSGLVKKYLLEQLKQTLAANRDIEKILQDLGFDPLGDLHRVVYAQGSAGTGKDLLIVNARLDVARIQTQAGAALKQHPDALRFHKVPDGQGGFYGIYEVLKLPENRVLRLADQPLFIALLDRTTVVASREKEPLIEALHKRAGRGKTQLKHPDLQALLAQVGGEQTIWLAARGDVLGKPGLFGRLGLETFAPKIEGIQGGIRVGADVRVEVLVSGRTVSAARELQQAGDDALSQARKVLAMLAEDQKLFVPLRDFLTSVQVRRDEKTLRASGRLTETSLDQASK
jgi:hypothetical protein